MDERYVDQETGEVLRQETILLRSDQTFKVFRKGGGRRIKFVKFRTSHRVKRLIANMPNDELVFFFRIALYATEGYNYLMGDNERGRRDVPLATNDFAKITKTSVSTTRRHLKNLADKTVIKQTETKIGHKVWAINPLYAINGKEPAPELLQLFSQEIEASGERVDGND
ncbi:hypothetical protein J31TS6_07890 [Brevibacillus reuszeri]|uniref:hypothetical protein n=1 Tax=Brevibacillus reuszeri TaxID=54915 RepID=UPI001B19F954|nr:hypothetical protein [Brevibacillus reuszeri]GIO04761.1 hypothetical protein J31TS6_07890 [Brevibacillus reuszeri]